MEKFDLLRIVAEVVVTALLGLVSYKTFKFKDALTTLIRASKDMVITEEEFQDIVDEIKKDLYSDDVSGN